MVSIIFQDGAFKVKGTWNFGIAGVFENKEYGDGNIEVGYSFDELCECLDKHYTYRELSALMEGVARNGEEYAKVLTDFYNRVEQKMIANQKLINNHILINVFMNMNICGNPFWENKDTLTEEYKNKELTEAEVYTAEANEAINRLDDAYYDNPNDGSVEKPDAEKILRKKLPMFNFDGLYATIKPEYCVLNVSGVSFQSSDGWDQSIMCAAYDEFDESLVGTDWHNF